MANQWRVIHEFDAWCVFHSPSADSCGRAMAIRTLIRHPIDGWHWLRHGVMPEWVNAELPGEENH